jgi:von Willebrand factor type A domain
MSKKTKALTTAVALVLDETGSMQGTVTDTIGAVNGYFETLANDTPEARVSVMEFSDCFGAEPSFRVLASDVLPGDVPKLTVENYRPRGNTPLYDAIGKAITETEGIKADRYLLVVLTDGHENASREWTAEGVKKLIEKKQGESWTILYLGANHDAWGVGAALGIHRGNTMAYAQTGAGVTATAASLSGVTRTLAMGQSVSTDSAFADAGQTAADYTGEDDEQQPPKPEETTLWGKRQL